MRKEAALALTSAGAALVLVGIHETLGAGATLIAAGIALMVVCGLVIDVG